MAINHPPLLSSTANTSRVPKAVLLCYQQDWTQDDSPLKIGEKSRRVGLTWAEASDDVMIAAKDKKYGGQNVYYIGYNQDMTVEFIEACAMWARAFNHAADKITEGFWEDEDKQIKTFSIKFPKSGNRITALSSRPSNLRGKQGVVVIDEAAFHEDLQGLIKAALALMIWGGKVRIISTHFGDDNPFNELINEIRAGKREGSVHRITFKQAVAQGLYERVCLRRGIEATAQGRADWVKSVYDFYGDDAEEELDVIPSQGGGRWLSSALLDKLADDSVPVVQFTAPKDFDTWTEHARHNEVADWCEEHLKPLLDALPPNVKSYYGLDFARKRDACSCWVQLETTQLKRRCPFVLEMYQTPYKQQEQILKYVVSRLPQFNYGAHDGNGNGGYLAEAMQVEFGAHRVEAVHLYEGWYRQHTPHFKASLEDGDIENIPKHSDIHDDHRAFVKVKGVPRIPDKRSKGKDGNMRHGDSGIAHLLCDYASTHKTAEIAWTPMPDTHDDMDSDDNMFMNAYGGW